MQKIAKRFILIIVAAVCLILGAVTLPLPLPTGVILITVGVALLIMTSKTFRRFIRYIRTRYPRLDRGIKAVQDHLPSPLRKAVVLSRPRSRDEKTPSSFRPPLQTD